MINTAFLDPLNPYDPEPRSARAATMGVVNAGDGQTQAQRHIPELRRVITLDFSVTEASAASALISGMKRVPIPETINYIGLSPTIRNETLLCSLGDEIEWVLISGVFYPRADYIIRANAPTIYYRVPAMAGYSLHVAIYPDSGYAAPYTDGAKLIVGYLPDESNRVIARE